MSDEEQSLNEEAEAQKMIRQLIEDDQKKEFVKKLVDEEKQKQVNTNPDEYVSKADMAKALDEIRTENEKLRNVVLKAKAQGKAHISEPDSDPDAEIRKIYGNNTMINRILPKK